MSQRTQVKITLSPAAADKLDRDRGDIKKSAWIEALILGIAIDQIATRARARDVEADLGAGEEPESQPLEADDNGFLHVGGWCWANLDDVVQRAIAISAWASQRDRNEPPDPLPYRGSISGDVEKAELLGTTPEMWEWVDQELAR